MQARTNAQARTNGSSLSRNRLGSPSLPPLHLLVRYSPIFHCKPTPFSFCKSPLCHPFSNRTPISCLDNSAFKLFQFCGTQVQLLWNSTNEHPDPDQPFISTLSFQLVVKENFPSNHCKIPGRRFQSTETSTKT